MSAVIQFAFDFQTMECGECGMVFAITSSKYKRCKEAGENWYCPNGHCRIFSKSEIQRLQKQLEQEKKRREWAEQSRSTYQRLAESERHRAASFKGVATKLKKRIANGVCPCCKRSFQNLRRHIDSKHPEFKEVTE